MNIIISNTPIESNNFKPFTPTYDKIYVSFDAEVFKNNYDSNLTDKNIKKLLSVINNSWDGEIYWFKNADNILPLLQDWFQKEKNHVDLDDSGISNCLLIKETPNGICIIDSQSDMSSNFSNFLTQLQHKKPGVTYEYYSDCHLIDNIRLGRDSINNEFEVLYFLYKEKVLDSSFFLNGLSSLNLDEPENEYYQLLPNDKEIVITGKLASERDNVLAELEEAGYTTSNTVKANSWLWYGDKVGANKIEAAKAKNILCNSVDEVIEQAYQKYLSNKHSLTKKMKMKM